MIAAKAWLDFLGTMYGRVPADLLQELAISPITENSGEELSTFPIVVGSTQASWRSNSYSIVVTSTCVDHCKAQPDMLAATVAADLVAGALVSQTLGIPMISFLVTGEEMRLVPGGEAEREEWTAVSKVVQNVFDSMEVSKGSKTFDTMDPTVWSLLQAQVETDRLRLRNADLAGLYRFDGSTFPAGTPFQYFYEYYRFNVAHYRLPLLEKLTGLPLDAVLVVENLQQVKAVALARILNGNSPTDQLVTLPAPGRTGSTRATRSGDFSLIELAHEFDELKFSQPHLQFWQQVRAAWKPDLLGSSDA